MQRKLNFAVIVIIYSFLFSVSDPFHETDPVSQKSVEIMENFPKNQPKSQECHIFFQKY